MVILTNCLKDNADEGCLKVSTALTKRIKKACPTTTVLSYERRPEQTDGHLRLNKLFLNRKLYSILNEKKEAVLYIPFSACTRATVLRLVSLSLFSSVPINVLFVESRPLDAFFRCLLRWTKVRIYCISRNAFEYFSSVSKNEVIYLKTGVDTEKFKPVDGEEKLKLRIKYGIEETARVLLHVGHLDEGRNIRSLLDVDESFHIILVVSMETRERWDEKLRADLLARDNITIIDSYIEKIEEIYQLSDVYYFPVLDTGHCIDTPLSALEAAACGLPVVATAYGELKELAGKKGFFHIRAFERNALNALLAKACSEKEAGRDSVLEYSWDKAVGRLLRIDEMI